MAKSTASQPRMYTEHALLCLLDQKAQELKLLDPVHQLVKINQKTLVHSPTEKLVDALLAIACGAEALSKVNTVLRADLAISRAWGRKSCADQSSVQETLSKCRALNIQQMQQAPGQIYQKWGLASHHDYATGPLMLDIDLTGLPCSKNYAGACKGYFVNCKKGTTGRQFCRVSASQYDEIVYQKVWPGNTSSADLAALKAGLTASLEMLGLSGEQKGQLLIRLDGGFGTTDIINYLYNHGYQFIVKLHSANRSKKLGHGLQEDQWHRDHNGLRWASLLDEATSTIYGNGNEGQEPKSNKSKLRLIAVRCKREVVLKEKEGAGAKATKQGRAKSEYAYSILALRRESIKEAQDLADKTLLEQLAFYDEHATIESY